MYLTNGNTKLGEGIWNFNLPLTSCRFKTKLCEKLCYAKKGHFCYDSVENHSQENLRLAKGLRMVEELQKEILKHKIKRIRAHSSGDFFSQAYLNKWVKIAKRNPLVRIVAYTRNWVINATGLPKNFNLFFSVDSSTRNINPTIKRMSFMGHHCSSGVYQCHKKCGECLYCYKQGGDVFFHIH